MSISLFGLLLSMFQGSYVRLRWELADTAPVEKVLQAKMIHVLRRPALGEVFFVACSLSWYLPVRFFADCRVCIAVHRARQQIIGHKGCMERDAFCFGGKRE